MYIMSTRGGSQQQANNNHAPASEASQHNSAADSVHNRYEALIKLIIQYSEDQNSAAAISQKAAQSKRTTRSQAANH